MAAEGTVTRSFTRFYEDEFRHILAYLMATTGDRGVADARAMLRVRGIRGDDTRIMDCAESTAKVHLHRGRRRLAERLGLDHEGGAA